MDLLFNTCKEILNFFITKIVLIEYLIIVLRLHLIYILNNIKFLGPSRSQHKCKQ